MASLEELRKSIDSLDDEITRLLNQRAELVLGVKRAKQEGNIDIYSPTRERQILDRVTRLVPGGQFPSAALERIFSNIISATRSLIGELSVAYIGAENSLGHVAAVKQFGETLKFCPETSVEEVFHRVESGDRHYGVVPARTTAGGLASKTFELLMASNLVIIAELEVKEKISLLGSGTSLAEVKQVIGDAYSFSRTLAWIKSILPSASLELVENPDLRSEALKKYSEKAVVSLESNAEVFGLHVLASGIESESGADARFVVLGQKTPAPTGRDKTSLVCATPDKAGALREILQPFAERGITLLRIESRPMKNRAWESVFFIDALGHEQDAELGSAIAQLRKISAFVKVLGSYPSVCQS